MRSPHESRTWIAGILVSMALAACAHGGPREFDVGQQTDEPSAPEAAGASLAGVWAYNPGESSRPGQMARGGPVGGGGMGGRGGRPGGGGQPGAQGGPGIWGPAPERLAISQTDSSITIRRPGGAALTLYFDGRDVWVPGITGDDQIQMNARWHRGKLEVRRVISDRRSVIESYELASNGARLVIRVRATGRASGEMEMPEMRRVYDRVRQPPTGQEPGN